MMDPILSEIRQIRETYASKFNYDVYAMLRDLRKRQSIGGRQTAKLPVKHSVAVEKVVRRD